MISSLLLAVVAVAPDSTPREAKTIEDVLVAAFRSQIAEVFATKGSQFTEDPVICLGVTARGNPRDPDEPLLKRLAADPSVRPASKCVVDGEAAEEKGTGREAVVLRSGAIEWLGDDEAHVEMSFYRSKLSHAALVIRVVREPHGWIGLGPTWKQSRQRARGR